jgi:DNA (cytosine-5)-methyltransferase 1
MEAGLLDPAPIWTDLKTFPWAEFRDRVDILTGGYPCQPFSAAGKRLGTDDPRHLWPFIADGIRILRPKLCFFENVEGHISLGLREVIGELESIGYKTAWGIFSASEVGAPHQRKRVFILAHSECAGLEGWIGGLQPEGDRRGPSGDVGESGNLLVNAVNNGGSNVSRIECSQKKQPLFGFASGDVADTNDGGSWEDKQSSQLWTNGIEQPSRNCGHSNQTANEQVWPSRPGERQQGWEPPRVVGDAKHDGLPSAEIAGSVGQEPSERRVQELAGGCCVSDGAMGNPGSQRREQDPALRGEQQPSGAGKERGAGVAEKPDGKIERTMGYTIDGTPDGLGHAELSSLCDSELAEIREWMVKCDNRTDELRLLGNGVVPATAERAFRILMEELIQ